MGTGNWITHLTPNVPRHLTNAPGRLQGKKWIKTITTDGTEEFKIICQPEYDTPGRRSNIEPNYKAYDLLPIPCRKKGTLQFDFEIDTETDKLKLNIKHRGPSTPGKMVRSSRITGVEFDLWVPPGSRCLQIWDCVEDIERKTTTAFAGEQDDDGSEDDEAEEMEIDSGAEEKPIQQARNLRSSFRGPASRIQQPAADVDMGAAAPDEMDQDGVGNPFSAASILQAQAGATQGSAEDVEMGGMDDEEEAADNITVAPMPAEPSQPPRTRGHGAPRRRRGSRISRGIFAL